MFFVDGIIQALVDQITKVLVTGAAGSLGKNVVDKLLKDSTVQIFATDIKHNPFAENIRVSYQQFDCRSTEFIEWIRNINPDQVIHLASILQLSDKMSRQQAYQIDVIATESLLNCCVNLKVKKFIITSSGAAYGYYKENSEIITEEREPRGNNDYFYSAHKAEIEKTLQSYRLKHPELEQLIFRPGAVLGPNVEGPIVDLFQQKVIVGLINYPGPFNFIWSLDVADYIVEGVKTGISGIYNIAGDGTLTMREIAHKLNTFYLPLPVFLLRLILTIAKPLGLTPYGPEQIKFIQYRPVLSNDKIKASFQHQPRYTTKQVLEQFLATQETE